MPSGGRGYVRIRMILFIPGRILWGGSGKYDSVKSFPADERILTVIRCEHHYGAVSQPQVIQCTEQPSNLGVHVRHGSVVVLADTQLEGNDSSKLKEQRCGGHGSDGQSSHLEVFGDGSVREADVQFLHIISPPDVGPGVVGNGWEEFRNIRVRGQSHLVNGIQTEVFLSKRFLNGCYKVHFNSEEETSV